MSEAVQFDTSGVGVGYHGTAAVGVTPPVACRKPCASTAGASKRAIDAQDEKVVILGERVCLGY